jgi:hypothetical protein
MPLDHYVSQVHLRQFYSTELPQAMFATRKIDLATYRCNSKSQCRVKDGSTNQYLDDPRIIEKFLINVENEYNAALDSLRRGHPTENAVFSISGFVSYVMCCSPAAMRINTPLFRSMVRRQASLLERLGELPPAPKAMGGGTLSQMLDDGRVVIDIDKKFPQAVGISNILERLSAFGNSKWEIIRNLHSDSQFFTSDYPIGNEARSDPRILNRIVPLAPDIAIRICPSFDSQGKGMSFPKFSYSMTSASKSEAISINREIVRCAETVVYYSRSDSWRANFIKKHRHYRVDAQIDELAYDGGTVSPARQATLPFRYDQCFNASKAPPVGQFTDDHDGRRPVRSGCLGEGCRR